ncbi:MAG: hypothetical protein WCQ50_20330 [Spirochaetota bacterium]
MVGMVLLGESAKKKGFPQIEEDEFHWIEAKGIEEAGIAVWHCIDGLTKLSQDFFHPVFGTDDIFVALPPIAGTAGHQEVFKTEPLAWVEVLWLDVLNLVRY